MRTIAFIQQAREFELNLCVRANRACHRHAVNRFFTQISRLGDGILWYGLILTLPLLFGKPAVVVSLQMCFVGVTGLLIYKYLKGATERIRPYAMTQEILLGTDPLDQYSFPSGHTLHAVGFTTTACLHYPILIWVLMPFALLVAASRIILGLHYPTDVLAGAGIGALVAIASFTFI